MQAMLAAFISMNTSGIHPTKANPIDRTFPPLFTINLLEEKSNNRFSRDVDTCIQS